MEKNEIKKILYKEKPEAVNITKDMGAEVITYRCITSAGKSYFEVPVSEMGENVFANIMPAQLLIRWLV